jgi:glycosyltransferase involved in cell wall biosynthesis
VDLDLFREIDRCEARAILGWPAGRPTVIVSAQSDSGVKRVDLARRAVEIARRELPALELKLLRGVNPEDAPLHLNAADVVLMTSQHEGSPNVVKEALACNVSVVSVDVGDVRRWVGGTPGCSIEPRSPEALARAIVRAVKSGGRSAGRAVVEPISQADVARQIVAVYERALKHGRAG